MAGTLNVQVLRGPNVIREEQFDRDIIKIGRLASAHLKLDDPKVARIHAVIEATSDGEGYSIIDMGSTDGTFVNGERISKERLKDGDEVTVGDCKLVVRLGAAQASVAAVTGAESSAPVPALASDLPAPAMVAPSMTPSATPVAPSVAAASSPPDSLAPGRLDTGTQPLRPGSFVEPSQDEMLPPSTLMELTHGTPSHSPARSTPPAAYSSPPASVWPPPGLHYGAWGSAPNNLASQSVPDTDRQLEIKVIWGSSILETFNEYDKPAVTMGDRATTKGWGPFAQYVGCDIDLPAKNLPDRAFPIAESMGKNGCNYAINIHTSFGGRLERADGSVIPLDELYSRGDRSNMADTWRVPLLAEDTLYLEHQGVILQIRYVRRTKFIPPGFLQSANFTYINIFVLAFFFHLLMIASFISTPQVQEELSESIFKNPSRFRQFEFIKQKQQEKQNSLLAKLKAGPAGAKARGSEGKAGSKKSKDKNKRMAVKGDPNDKEIAKSTLNKLFGGAAGAGNRSYLFGSGGLGGELKGALGGVTGAEIGDSEGLGGLGTRGAGPGGGGLSMSSVGLGALGTAGRGGGGDGSYGSGVGSLGKKANRDISISAGTPVIMGSLDKEIIRRVIKAHIAQIRYCYEKELIRTPGLFGKVNMEFTIKATGHVRDSKVKESTLGNPEVERCIGAKIRTWKFPKPKGGGIVIVRYPFVFKRTG